MNRVQIYIIMEICNAFMDFIELNELKAKHKSNLLEGEIKK